LPFRNDSLSEINAVHKIAGHKSMPAAVYKTDSIKRFEIENLGASTKACQNKNKLTKEIVLESDNQ